MDNTSSIIVCSNPQLQIKSQFESRQLLMKLKTVNFHQIFPRINSIFLSNDAAYSAILQGKRQVKPKMITKLLSWLQKLCNQTLQFSTCTLQTACRILLQYLCLFDEPVCNLQLVGCACLYLSSKISQRTIIAAESYAQCSCNIFTATELMAKQANIYTTINGNTDFSNLHDIYQYIHHQILSDNDNGNGSVGISDQHHERILKLIGFCVKDAEFLGQVPSELLCTIIETVIQEEEEAIQIIRATMGRRNI